MREITGDLWEQPQKGDALVITTNGFVKNNGRGVMGAGVARQARDRINGIDLTLGQHIRKNGNVVGHLLWTQQGYAIVSFPTKHNWMQGADLDLIRSSVWDLRLLADAMGYRRIFLPRPGCGNGRLQWTVVFPLLAPALDDRFIVVDRAFSSSPLSTTHPGAS